MYRRGEASGARGVQHCSLPCLELRRLDRGQAETKRPALPNENMHKRAKCFIIIIFFSVLVQQKVWWRGLQPAGQMSGPPGPEPARSSGEIFRRCDLISQETGQVQRSPGPKSA